MERSKKFQEILFEHYTVYSNKEVEIMLNNHKKIRGVVIGFFQNEKSTHSSCITALHIVSKKLKNTLGADSLGARLGRIISTATIKEIIIYTKDNIITLKNPS